MNRIFPIILVAALSLLTSCGPVTETWTLEVSEHDPMKTSFTQNWYSDAVTVVYYPNAIKWEDAINLAYCGEWKQAVEKWMSILDGDISLERRRYAEYNIALGCFLMGEWKVADMWLNQCLSDFGSGNVPSYVSRLKKVNDTKIRKYSK